MDKESVLSSDTVDDESNVVTPEIYVDLDTAVLEAKAAVDLFFNNQFQDAWDLLKPGVGTSMYHTVGNSFFHFLEAMLTFEHVSIQKASNALKECISLCNRYRKKNKFSDAVGKMVKRTNYDHHSTYEIHAELCYAESLLLKSMLSFIEDETLVSFIKAGLKVRSCFVSYKDCQVILNSKHWHDEPNKVHFESGVRMGIGTFNLMISHLPSKIIKLLEFIGFSADRDIGMEELLKCYQLTDGLRHVLSVLMLLSYHLFLIHLLSHHEGDVELCDDIISKELKIYPNGACFLYFKGRLEFMKGDLTKASEWYVLAWRSQTVWPQIHHLCFWELMWTHLVQLDWAGALEYADQLLKKSAWSPTIYSYHKASIMLMTYDKLTSEEKHEIDELMNTLLDHKRQIGGKLLPMEKFCIKKSERYFAQNKRLLLPVPELIFVWNMFKVVGKKLQFCSGMFEMIEDAQKLLDGDSTIGPYDADNRALVLMLKGSCLHQMNELLQAEEALEGVLSLEKKIKDDTYLVPYSLVQLAIIHSEQGDVNRAIQILENAKRNYSGYSLESRLNFQIHSALQTFHGGRRSNESLKSNASTISG